MRPYPYERWPRLSRSEAAERSAQARAGPLAALAGGAASASSWLGADVVVALAGAPSAQPAEVGDPRVAVLFEDGAGARSALLLDAVLASVIIDCTVGADPERLDAAAGPLRDVERGVLAYAVGRWIAGRTSHLVAGVVTSAPALEAHLGEAEIARWPLAVRVGAVRGRAALLVPRALREAPAPPASLPRWALALPIEHAVTAGSATLPARQVRALAAGDVVLPDRPLTLDRGALAGHVELAARAARRAFRAELAGGALRVVAVEPRAPVRDGRGERVTMKETMELLETMGETPVTLSLEVARFTLRLEDVAALAPGEVVRTGAAIGASVTLRAGERVVARGELVDVEGEIGVRIAELATGD